MVDLLWFQIIRRGGDPACQTGPGKPGSYGMKRLTEDDMAQDGQNQFKGGNAMTRRIFCFLMMISFLNISLAWAQEKGYPTKSIEVIVPASPGGSSDIATRIIAEELSRQLKVPFVVTNIAGAAGMAGAARVLKARPDGYTLLSSGTQGMISSPIQSPNPPFDTFKDFTPICSYGSSPMIFGIKSSSPFKTLEDLINYGRKNPDKLTCGITNIGGEPHLLIELFKKGVGVNIKPVPHKGTGDAVTALLGQHIDMMVLTYIGFLPYIKSGEARVLAITQKVPGSGIPTFAELGYPKVNIRTQLGFYVSSKTPGEIQEKLISLLEKVTKDPNVARKLETSGVVVDYRSPREFTNELKEEWDTVSKLADEIGLKQK
jgi:tripartite-type tricarboxylate transporter receptor subunit TctC